MNPHEVCFRERETLEFEKFPTPSTCGYWQLKFRTEFCSGSCRTSMNVLRDSLAYDDGPDDAISSTMRVEVCFEVATVPVFFFLSDVIFKTSESCCNRIEFISSDLDLVSVCFLTVVQRRLLKTDVVFFFFGELWPHQPDTMNSSQRLRHSKKKDLKTSQSMTGNQYPNFEMLDVKVATTLKKSLTITNFKKKGFLGWAERLKSWSFFWRWYIAYMIYEYFQISVT